MFVNPQTRMRPLQKYKGEISSFVFWSRILNKGDLDHTLNEDVNKNPIGTIH